MSKIEKALEKAKRARGVGHDQERIFSSHKDSVVQPQKPSFEQARVISLERNHLERNRYSLVLACNLSNCICNFDWFLI